MSISRVTPASLGVFVRYGDRQLGYQLFHIRKHRCGVSELWKHNKSYWQERRCPGDGRINHGKHAIRIRTH